MAIIKNIGYMWHRKHVNWDTHELTGYSDDKEKKKVNFAYQAGIYVLYNRNFECIYVGQAGKGKTNLSDQIEEEHEKQKNIENLIAMQKEIEEKPKAF